ncbi:MAG: Lrp/AsnC ligand binding domain-containing protein [Paludibacteraceae bacterium]|nr:Lrp/AsnC ligand binding domain-containing protein [Candidatus Physcocola equi]MCQ2234008.1 Lrp/AsnC ligand binding domain-containing protein [Paludibacteraceae bacterium]
MAHHQLDHIDAKILKMISANARIPFLEVARVCRISGAAIHQRIQKLQKLGVIKGSEFIIDPSTIGYSTCAFMGIFLKDANMFKSVVKELEKIPEIVECHYTTGRFAMFIKIYAKDNQDFLRIIHEKLQPIEGISSTETIVSLSDAFQRQIPIDGIEVSEENESGFYDEDENEIE